MRIAVYGIGRVAQGFCNKVEDMKNIEILYFVQSKKTEDYFHNKKVISADEIDYSKIDNLIIASNIYYEEIIAYLKNLNNDYELNKDKVKSAADFPVVWEDIQRYMPYASCKVCKDIVYISSSEDDGIGGAMFKSGRNYPDDMIHVFFELAEKYYKTTKQPNKGYFLDIGANIGTTSIYIKKKIDNNLKIIGFEAGKSNYDLFRINCILNQVEDIRVELLGLSDSNIRKKYRYVAKNSGGSGIVEDDFEGGVEISTIDMMKLDDYLEKNYISSEEIDYIWMDTEGHEYEIITGGFKTLQAKKIPLLQEFNAVHYIGKRSLECYCEKIGSIYDYFIDVHEYMNGKINIIPIAQIYDFAKKMEKEGTAQTDLFFF